MHLNVRKTTFYLNPTIFHFDLFFKMLQQCDNLGYWSFTIFQNNEKLISYFISNFLRNRLERYRNYEN